MHQMHFNTDSKVLLSPKHSARLIQRGRVVAAVTAPEPSSSGCSGG